MSDTSRRAGRRRFTVDALFTDTRPQAVGVADLEGARTIAIARIDPDPDQPRRHFDEDLLDELAASIARLGVLQPIAVRYAADTDRYIVVHGERRWRASQRAGLERIPAIVRDVPDDQRLLHQLTENIVRDDLNAVDRANALRQLKAILDDAPWDDVATIVGIRKSRLFQLLGTEKLSTGAQEAIQRGDISEKQSRALQGLPANREAAMRDLLIRDRLPEAAAMKLARAFRELPLPNEEAETVGKALADLRSLLLPDDPAAIRHQTETLLRALARAAAGEKADRRRLQHLTKLVGSPTYDETKFTREVGSLARMLSNVPDQRSEDIDSQLRAMRDAITALLGDRQDS